MKASFTLSLPEPLVRAVSGLTAPDPESRMRAVIDWARKNSRNGEGPFAAGIFNLDAGECVAAGVNRVVASNCSPAHAELMAIMFAQQTLDTHDLSTRGAFVLTTSAQPCSQCFGALPWSGIKAMEFGASREDVEAVGFDEGPCPDDWRELLERRGIRVSGPILREPAAAVLREYAVRGGPIY